MSGSYRFMQLLGLLDDAFVSAVRADHNQFMAREERMYRAADEPFAPLRVTADYLFIDLHPENDQRFPITIDDCRSDSPGAVSA